MAEVRLLFDHGVLLFLQLSLFVTHLTAAKVEIISSTPDVEVGVRHLLLCKAGADGRMTWLKDGDDIDEDQVEIENMDETTSKLIIKKARLEDAGLYTCHIDFDSGVADAEYQLYIYQRPKFVSTPTYHEFLEGEVAVLPCNAVGLPQVDVKWLKVTDGRGLDIPAAASAVMCEQISVLPNRSLRITNIQRKHSGTYTCEASIKKRPISAQIRISVIVNAPPTAVIREKKKSVLAGPRTNVTISCLVTGVPTPNISWMSPPQSDATRYKFNSDKSELTIPSVVRSDFGQYACLAVNKIGERQDSFWLDVTERPTVSLSKTGIEVEPGRNASVTCVGSGQPPPKIHWIRKGTDMELATSSLRVRAVGPTLHFDKIEPSDGGLYTCVGTSDVGNDTKDFSLETWPDTPPKIRVSAGPASAHVYLDGPLVDGGTPITHYVLEWRKPEETSWDQRIFQSAEPLVLTSLEPYTSYHVRLASKNRLGQGGFTSEYATQTLAKREPDSPVLIDGEMQVEKNSFSIPITQQDNGGTPIIHYIVRSKPDLEDSVWEEMQFPANATAIHLAGLQYNTSYHLEIVAVNTLGSSKPAYFSFGVPQDINVPKTTMGKGGVIAIVISIFLVLLIAVDATCCYVNRCGLLMYLAVKLLGEKAPGVKSVEEGNGDIMLAVDVKELRTGSIRKQMQQQNGEQNGVQMEVTCDKAPLTKFEKAPHNSEPATKA
ncbi:hypothetical protein GJAV_G00004760 [Gymnothorax javanicus]|nr:hypothetical protein GJAV_G00004760 [Gymnothorax javanicus]